MSRHRLWHTKQEKAVIRRHGGRPLSKYGYDGLLHGRPVEVRSVRRDNRYRIQKNVHGVLVRRKGAYIFVARNGRSKVMPARVVSRKLGRGNWFRDRKYPHRFLKTEDVF